MIGNEVSTSSCIVCWDLLSVDDSLWWFWHKWLCNLFWIYLILSVVMKITGLLPFALSKPCARHTNSLLIAFVQTWVVQIHELTFGISCCIFVKYAQCQWQCDKFVHYFLKSGELCCGLAQKCCMVFNHIPNMGQRVLLKIPAVRCWWVFLHNVLHCCLVWCMAVHCCICLSQVGCICFLCCIVFEIL